jgi:Zn-dependent protease
MTFTIVFVGWIFSLCLHEFSHAVAAYYGGDTTVKDKGYLTFNPLKYTHPLYSLVLPLVFLLAGGIALPGGAVYIEIWRLKNRTWQSLVSLAGPLSNLVLAIVLAIVLKFAPLNSFDKNSIWPGIASLAALQCMAVLLNLIPVPPFDGYGVIEPFLSINIVERVNSVRAYLPLLVFGALWFIPGVSEQLMYQVGNLAYVLGIPLDLANEGLARFFFWKP